MAEKREAQRRCRRRGPARPAWHGESGIASSPVPSWPIEAPSSQHLTTMLPLRVTESRSRNPLQRWEDAPSRAGQGVTNPHNGTKRPPKPRDRTVRVKRGIAYGERAYGDGAPIVVSGRESRPHGHRGEQEVQRRRGAGFHR